MLAITPHLRLAKRVRISNVWLLLTNGRRVLVDSGHPAERLALRYELWRAGIRGPGDLDGLILTHRHSDHAGNAAWVRRTFDCPVVCHHEDALVLTGAHSPTPMTTQVLPWWARTLCRIEDRWPARCPVDAVVTEGEQWRGLRVFHVPGHTSGSVVLHHETSRTLFTGDSVLSGPPVVRCVEWMRFADRSFSKDAVRARAEARRVLAALPHTEALCTGHGPPVVGALGQRFRLLANQPRAKLAVHMRRFSRGAAGQRQ